MDLDSLVWNDVNVSHDGRMSLVVVTQLQPCCDSSTTQLTLIHGGSVCVFVCVGADGVVGCALLQAHGGMGGLQ